MGAGAQQQAKKAPLPPKGGNMNIYVGNLSLEVTDGELQPEFMAFGVFLSQITKGGIEFITWRLRRT